MNHFISLTVAAEMTARYRSNRDSILKTDKQYQNILPVCESYDRSAFDALLNKSDCAGIRIYYGMDTDLKVHAIAVAYNADNEDILPSSNLAVTEGEDIVENGNRCPELCPPPSDLNTP